MRLATAKEQKEQTRLIKEQLREEEKIARDGMPGSIWYNGPTRIGWTRKRDDARDYFEVRMLD